MTNNHMQHKHWRVSDVSHIDDIATDGRPNIYDGAFINIFNDLFILCEDARHAFTSCSQKNCSSSSSKHAIVATMHLGCNGNIDTSNILLANDVLIQNETEFNDLIAYLNLQLLLRNMHYMQIILKAGKTDNSRHIYFVERTPLDV